MDKFPKTKVKFLVSLAVKHQAQGHRSVVHKIAMAHLDKLTLQPDDVVLDVGCGTGDETAMIATSVKKVIGIDVSTEILEIANRDYPADNVDYLLEDLEDSSVNTSKWLESFDKVVSFIRVMLYPDLEMVLRNMVACLKHGGEFLCAIPNRDFNFFDGAAKVIEEHPEWGQLVKKRNVTMWKKTESEAEKYFRDICEWSHLSCNAHQYVIPLSENKSKVIWLENLDHVDRVGTSQQNECLETLWQWAKTEYESTEEGYLKKPAEFMIIHGVKK